MASSVFGAPGATAETKLSLSERVDTLENPEEQRTPLSRNTALLRQRSKREALHLLRVGVPFGDLVAAQRLLTAEVERAREALRGLYAP